MSDQDDTIASGSGGGSDSDLTPAQFKRVEELYHRVSGLAPDAVEAFLDTHCSDDPRVRREVQILLDPPTLEMSDVAREGVLRRNLAGEGRAPTLTEGELFGRYRIGRPLGSGGMGQVFAAEELEGHRQLALKVITPTVASAVNRARFLREGKLAASVNHPNSVYVFSADETQGALVIAMELMPGGTLADTVKQRGPLPYTEAVDATLQIIAGLSAAEAKGVLHRDIKPANCFVDSDGTIKIGDYGLSKPTGDEETTAMTQAGTVMGTPSYAPPEQLKGQTVDMRSDIYAVGATLFFMLTGAAPFEGSNAVQVISAVLSEKPEQLERLDKTAPAGLRKIVLACLAKDPTRRPQSYRELEAKLREFGSALPQSASPGPRLFAATIDTIVSRVVGLAVAFVIAEVGVRLLGERWITETQSKLFGLALLVSYFALSEGFFSATPGKLLVGLRALRSSGRPLGIGWATLRALIFCGPVILGNLIGMVVWADQAPTALELYLVWFLLLVSPLVLFVGARADNGWMGLHDRCTGSRVSVRRRGRRVQTLDLPASGVAPGAERDRVAGFQVVGRLDGWPEAPLRLARDEVLGRDVWLHDHTAGIATPVERRQLSRPTRLRWIAGVAQDGWDAYESVDGAPITSLTEPQSWQRVRGWLRTALDEITAGQDEGSPLRLFSPRQVWVTGDGRLKLVEPGLLGLEKPEGDSWIQAQQVLLEAMGHALAPGERATEGAPPIPLPLRARDLLDRLGRGDFADPAEARSTLELGHSTPGSLAKRRALSVGLQAAFPVMTAGAMMLFVLFSLIFPSFFAQQANFQACLKKLVEFEDPSCVCGPEWETEHRALQICVVDGLDKQGQFASRWSEPNDQTRLAEKMAQQMIGKQGISARRALEEHPDPTKEDVAWAREQLEPLIEKSQSEAGKLATMGWLKRIGIASLLAGLVLGVVGLASLLTVPILRGGLTFRLLGLVVVREDGTPASRLRCLLRGLITWCLPLIGLLMLLDVDSFNLLPSWAERRFSAVMVSIMLTAAVWAVLHPSRGLQDRIARTRVVPR